MASLALQNSINIPPTGYVNQGERIMIFVARDVDFSNVYELVNAHYQQPRSNCGAFTLGFQMS